MGHGLIVQARSSTQRNGGYRRPTEAGRPTWRRRRARQGFRPRGRDMAAAPESDSSPTGFPLGPSGARLSHASPVR
jgi:hypothetical protein